MSTNTLLDDALDLARRGWSLFPLLPERKEPALPGSFKRATTNPETILRWWGACPTYNIGLAAGPVSGLFVVDIDPGGELPREAPPTLEATTGRGRHLYFSTDLDLPCTAGRIGSGIDTRGRGGYVVAPPSIHPSGARYAWANDLPPAPVPDWLIAAVARPPAPPAPPSRYFASLNPESRSAGRYGAAALRYETEELARAPKGQRNAALNRAAFALGQLAAAGELAPGEVVAALEQACRANGLIHDDGLPAFERTMRSGARAGYQNPRARP